MEPLAPQAFPLHSSQSNGTTSFDGWWCVVFPYPLPQTPSDPSSRDFPSLTLLPPSLSLLPLPSPAQDLPGLLAASTTQQPYTALWQQTAGDRAAIAFNVFVLVAIECSNCANLTSASRSKLVRSEACLATGCAMEFSERKGLMAR